MKHVGKESRLQRKYDRFRKMNGIAGNSQAIVIRDSSGRIIKSTYPVFHIIRRYLRNEFKIRRIIAETVLVDVSDVPTMFCYDEKLEFIFAYPPDVIYSSRFGDSGWAVISTHWNASLNRGAIDTTGRIIFSPKYEEIIQSQRDKLKAIGCVGGGTDYNEYIVEIKNIYGSDYYSCYNIYIPHNVMPFVVSSRNFYQFWDDDLRADAISTFAGNKDLALFHDGISDMLACRMEDAIERFSTVMQSEDDRLREIAKMNLDAIAAFTVRQ